MKHTLAAYLSLCLPALWLAACSPIVDNRGHVREPDWEKLIIAGQTPKEEVLRVLGSPSSASSFGEETWYYISARRETTAFLKPEVADQDVIRIAFAPDGMVSKVERFDKEAAKDFEVSRRVTPTEGHTLGFFEQILGNVGRFNKPRDTASSPASRPGGPGNR